MTPISAVIKINGFSRKVSYKRILLFLMVALSAIPARAPAASATHAEDTVTFVKSLDQPIPTCPPGQVLQHTGTAYSCVGNSPVVSCPPGQAVLSVDVNGGGACETLPVEPTTACTGNQVLASVPGGCISPPLMVKCKPGEVLTSYDGATFTCVSETHYFHVAVATTLTPLQPTCTDASILILGPPYDNAQDGFYYTCVTACNQFCQAQPGYAGGYLAEYDGLIGHAGCECALGQYP